MHGLNAADAIMRKVDSESDKNPGKSIIEVKVRIGRYLFPDLSLFTSAWNLIVQDTQLSNAMLTVESVDGKGCDLVEVVFSD